MAKISLRRGAALALSGLLAAGTLAGCAAESTDGGATDTGSSSSAESTTIRVVAAQYTDDMQPYYDDLVARFEADNPTINVEVEVVSWNDIDQKIKTMVQTNDGFEIAEVDLRLRGPGDLMGTQQSGVLQLKIADILKDQDILKTARFYAQKIVETDPEMEAEKHMRIRQTYAKIMTHKNIWNYIS